MKILEIVQAVNKHIPGEQLTYKRLIPFLNDIVDDINNTLSAAFPRFDGSLAEDPDKEYTAIPDRYISSVLCIGAAHQFLLIDEEGVDAAIDLGYKYRNNLFYMLRDYVEDVPEEYDNPTSGGVNIDTRFRIEQTPFDFDIWGNS